MNFTIHYFLMLLAMRAIVFLILSRNSLKKFKLTKLNLINKVSFTTKKATLKRVYQLIILLFKTSNIFVLLFVRVSVYFFIKEKHFSRTISLTKLSYFVFSSILD